MTIDDGDVSLSSIDPRDPLDSHVVMVWLDVDIGCSSICGCGVAA